MGSWGALSCMSYTLMRQQQTPEEGMGMVVQRMSLPGCHQNQRLSRGKQVCEPRFLYCFYIRDAGEAAERHSAGALLSDNA